MPPKPEASLSVGSVRGNPVTVLLAFDDGWSPFAATTMASVCAHAASPVLVVILSNSLSRENARKFSDIISSSSHALRIFKVDEGATGDFSSPGWWSSAAYLRLASAEVLPLDRVIYLDVDLIVRSPLDEVFDQDLGGAALAGAVDIPARLLQMAPRLNWLGLPKGDHYINTGVMLMDLGRLRSRKFYNAALEWYNENRSLVRLADQCILNSVLARQKASLHPRWNIRQLSMPKEQFADMLCSDLKGIFHFNGTSKPWVTGADPRIRAEWLKHLPTNAYREHDCIRPAPRHDAAFMDHIAEMEAAFAEAGIQPRVALREAS